MKKPPVNSWRRKCLIYAVKVLNGSGQHVKFSAEYPAIRILKKMDCILSAEPSYMLYLNDVAIGTNDPLPQWGLQNINIKEAWDDYSPNVSDIKVAIIDSGIAVHNDLNLNLGTGWDCYYSNNITTDDTEGHGTHVAGIVGAVGNNGIGISGVAQRVTLIPYQVTPTNSISVVPAAVLEAIARASTENIPIINASFGGIGGVYVPALYSAIENYAGLMICSAGNLGNDIDVYSYSYYPASFELPNIITVAAIDEQNVRWIDSNYGVNSVDIGAPGVGITSTFTGNTYASSIGTSMAAPHVTGAVALLKGNFPLATNQQIKEAILSSATFTPDLYGKVATNGRLNVKAALDYLNSLINGGYIVTYDANGGTGAPSPQSKQTGVPLTLSFDEPTKAGALFLGWSASSSATTPTYRIGGTFLTDANTTLYAVWKSNASYLTASARTYTSMMTKNDNNVLSWGRNNNGQLGDGSTTDRATPAQIYGLNNVKEVSIGGYSAMALKNDGTVWTWGKNMVGTLGNGTLTDNFYPQQIQGFGGVKAVSTSAYFCAALKTDGTVWTWGYNQYGMLGDGTDNASLSPIQVLGLSNVKEIATGSYHCLALKNDGTVWIWGNNTYGQLGNGNFGNGYDSFVPIQVPGLSDIVKISSGGYHSIALKKDGTVWAWGENYKGQIGDGTIICKTTPVQVPGLSNIYKINAGSDTNIALKRDGTVWAWGTNLYGAYGNGTTTSSLAPVQTSNLSGVYSVAIGFDHCIAIKEDGTAMAWGTNQYGQVGDGTITTRLTPVQIP